MRNSGVQKPIFISHLLDGTSDQMAINGSVTPVTFKIAPSSTEIYRITYWQMCIQDDKGFALNKLGQNTTCTNGLMPKLKTDGVAVSMLSAGIKTNADIACIARDFNLITFGTGLDILVSRWDFDSCGQQIRLDGSQGDELQLVVSDDLTGISSLKVTAAGYIERGY